MRAGYSPGESPSRSHTLTVLWRVRPQRRVVRQTTGPRGIIVATDCQSKQRRDSVTVTTGRSISTLLARPCDVTAPCPSLAGEDYSSRSDPPSGALPISASASASKAPFSSTAGTSALSMTSPSRAGAARASSLFPSLWCAIATYTISDGVVVDTAGATFGPRRVGGLVVLLWSSSAGIPPCPRIGRSLV